MSMRDSARWCETCQAHGDHHTDRHIVRPGERCYAVVGTVYTGPMYCGSPAKRVDGTGRPLCNRRHGNTERIAWHGDRYHYPEGTGDRGKPWRFANGPARAAANDRLAAELGQQKES